MSVADLPLHNGTTRGRFVMPRHSFTFPSSGITVECHKIGPQLQSAITQAVIRECKEGKYPDHPYPEPPKQMVDIGGEMVEQEALGGEQVAEYQKTLRAWGVWADQEIMVRYLVMAILDYAILDDKDISEVIERTRKALARQGADLPDLGIPLEGYSDVEINRLYYLFCVCALDPMNDGQAFFAFLVGRSHPREEAIRERIASFRTAQQSGDGSDVSG